MITTVFDASKDHPHRLLYSGSIHNALAHLLPGEFFFIEKETEFLKKLHEILPIFKWSEWEGSSHTISLFLLTRHRHNAAKFFYEMISRWLLPGYRLNISCFFATDFMFPEISSEIYILSEVVISLESVQDLERVRSYLPLLESEIKFGLISVYHANRILEIKGLSADEKTSLIQERIASLLEKRPKDFDSDIFTQMQHFLVMCGEEFKTARSYEHMSRIIYVFYFFHKTLRSKVETNSEQRFVLVKLSKTLLHFPLGVKKVLCVFIGLNFLNDNEMFEQRHLVRVLKSLVSMTRPIEDSYFSSSLKEEKIQILYLEVEKSDSEDFSLQEMRWLKLQLQDEVRSGVEKLKRPVFMPRNEEEIMRNIITLSKQLQYPKDMPQVIISFDEQTELELSFTIILVRILNGSVPSIHEFFEMSSSRVKFIPDRVKKIGTLRKKYVKEATVFRVIIPALDFIRPDHSIDLFKARQEVLTKLQQIVGEVRDYNGGMIAKQHEQFLTLKSLFPSIEQREDLLLENLFHSIFPVELRSVLNPLLIKTFFIMLLALIEKKDEGDLRTIETDAIFCVFFYQDPAVKQNIMENIEKLHLSSFQLITISLRVFEAVYFGYILRETDQEIRNRFLMTLERALDICHERGIMVGRSGGIF